MGSEKRSNRPIAVADIHCVDSGGGFDGIACCERWPEKILTPDLLLIIRSEQRGRYVFLCYQKNQQKDQARMIAQPAKKEERVSV